MTTNIICIYHRDCADGIGSAWAVHSALGDHVEFVSAKYGDIPPYCGFNAVTGLDAGFLRDRDILIVDFSYSLEILRAIATQARSILVLDHHKTAQKDLEELESTDLDYEDFRHNAGVLGNIAAIFDMNRSGAGLTWDYLTNNKPRPPIIDLIEDRDLWRFRLQNSRTFHAVLTSYDISDLSLIFGLMDDWMAMHPGRGSSAEPWRNLIQEGRAILRAQQQAVASVVKVTRRAMRIAGHVVNAANVPGAMASEAGNLLCSQNDTFFSATYYDGADGRRHFSLRSLEDGADVGEIARQYGGGGHAHAAGFDMQIGWEGE